MVSCLAAVMAARMTEIVRDDGSAVHLSYLPLPHVFERVNQMVMFAFGGRVGYYQGDTLKILDDLVALRPTFFPSVPRLLTRVHDKIMAGVNAAGGVKATLFHKALQAKVANLRQTEEGKGTLKHKLWDSVVFNPLKKRLGLDRVEVILTGSTPLSDEVMSFLRAAFGVPVIEGYGQTESAAVATITQPDDYTTGHVGIPLSSNEIALFDVPEMGYNSTDKKHGDIPCRGRGEICFRGVNVFKEYYKMPEKTAEALDQDGWLHSGDIGIWTVAGKLKIVDRKKNIFKLSQGEYVAAEKIENVLATDFDELCLWR
jgi:long-chain acyl-CoA synthetase